MSRPAAPPMEEKPSFWRRPVPMWAFIILVVFLVYVVFINPLLVPPLPADRQPLVITPDTRTVSLTSIETTTANFTVADLNLTTAIAAIATPVLYYSNSTQVPSSGNITLTVYGVYAGTSFTATGANNSVTFQPGGNTLVIDVKAQSARPGIYSLAVALTTT